MGRFPSGQRGQTVNLLQLASVVRIHLRPLLIQEVRECKAPDWNEQFLASCGKPISGTASPRCTLICKYKSTQKFRKKISYVSRLPTKFFF